MVVATAVDEVAVQLLLCLRRALKHILQRHVLRWLLGVVATAVAEVAMQLLLCLRRAITHILQRHVLRWLLGLCGHQEVAMQCLLCLCKALKHISTAPHWFCAAEIGNGHHCTENATLFSWTYRVCRRQICRIQIDARPPRKALRCCNCANGPHI